MLDKEKIKVYYEFLSKEARTPGIEKEIRFYQPKTIKHDSLMENQKYDITKTLKAEVQKDLAKDF